MADDSQHQWKTLDKDLGRIGLLEYATRSVARPLVAPGLALAFVLLAVLLSGTVPGGEGAFAVIAASALAAYMALCIGANDVANNVGPAVGARALTLGGALVLAALFEVSGALIAGSEVVTTISDGIVQEAAFATRGAFVSAMLAALFAAALWISFATWIGAVVSTTHSIVGGVMGAGIAAAGFSAVNWPIMVQITLSWVISPLAGGLIAAVLLAFITRVISEAPDRLQAARFWVPMLIAAMVSCFSAYLGVKGLLVHTNLGLAQVFGLSLATGAISIFFTRPLVRRQSEGLTNKRKSLKKLFNPPLVVSAALLSFSHGASDVSNAVAPLAAIVRVYGDPSIGQGGYMQAVGVPFWVMMIGGIGIASGLLLFGPKLVTLVGTEITRLNPVRAFCVALATAIAVMVAVAFGLPVSSTHIAVGAIFGLGFYREWREARRGRSRPSDTAPAEERTRRRLVRRSHVLTMLTAWTITLPLTACLAALVFIGLSALA